MVTLRQKTFDASHRELGYWKKTLTLYKLAEGRV